MSHNTAEDNLNIYKFVKYFVLAAERTKNAQASSEVIELLGAACQAIPFAGAFVDKAVTTAGKKAQKMSKSKGGNIIETIVDSNSTEAMDREDKFRRIMISAAVEIFQSFKHQLENIYFVFNGKESREVALQILAEFAGQRCLQQLVATGSAENLHKVLLESSLKSKIKISSKSTKLVYHLYDTKRRKTFQLSTNDFKFFREWIPAYLPDDRPVTDLMGKSERKNRRNCIWFNTRTNGISKEKLVCNPADCCYYLRPRFSWEIEGVIEGDIEALDVTVSCRTFEEFKQLDQDNEDLVDQILKMLHHDENYDLSLATFSFVKSIGSKVELLNSKADGIKGEVEIANTGIKEIKALIETQAKKEESVLENDYTRFAQIFLEVKDIAEKGWSEDRGIVTVGRVVEILKELRPQLSFPNDNDALISREQYPIKEAGSVLIINNIHFEETRMHRHGAEKDSDRFLKFFTDTLKINVVLYQDIRSADLPRYIETFKEECITQNSSFSIVIIMSHGSHGDEILMQDMSTISFFSDVVEQFNHLNFPGFIQKPKLFFTLQACSSAYDSGYCTKDKSTMDFTSIQDYFIGSASQQGYRSYRNPTEGSFYTQALLEAFEKFWKVKDVAEMHNYASKAVTEMTNNFKESQHPWTFNGLRHPFYFVQRV